MAIGDRQREVLLIIPVYKSGEDAGKPTNERLRELHRMLSQFNYGDKELQMMRAEVLAAMSRRQIENLKEQES